MTVVLRASKGFERKPGAAVVPPGREKDALDALLVRARLDAALELELQPSRRPARRQLSGVSFDDECFELEDGLDAPGLAPVGQVGETDVVEVVHARLREGEPGLLRVDAERDEDVLGDVVEADAGLDLVAARRVEPRLALEDVLVEALDRDLGDVERRVEVEPDVRRVEPGERLDDGRPALSELGRRIDDDGDLE